MGASGGLSRSAEVAMLFSYTDVVEGAEGSCGECFFIMHSLPCPKQVEESKILHQPKFSSYLVLADMRRGSFNSDGVWRFSCRAGRAWSLALYADWMRLCQKWCFLETKKSGLEWSVFRLVLGYMRFGCFLLRMPLNWSTRQLGSITIIEILDIKTAGASFKTRAQH